MKILLYIVCIVGLSVFTSCGNKINKNKTREVVQMSTAKEVAELNTTAPTTPAVIHKQTANTQTSIELHSPTQESKSNPLAIAQDPLKEIKMLANVLTNVTDNSETKVASMDKSSSPKTIEVASLAIKKVNHEKQNTVATVNCLENKLSVILSHPECLDIATLIHKQAPWLTKAATRQAIINFSMENYHITWLDGTWLDGTWENGTWKQGFWRGGTWKNGTWEDGYWEKGTWENGTWEDGVWITGVWKNGTWEDGVWKDGTWEDGTWEGGYWKNGVWRYGIWENGTWEGGIWVDGTWKDGLQWNPEISKVDSGATSPWIRKSTHPVLGDK